MSVHRIDPATLATMDTAVALGEYMTAARYPIQPGRKTYQWVIHSASSGMILGYVSWYARWRQYAFFPRMETVFNPACMEELAKFCREQTHLHG